MRILITNDDGIQSEGLKILAKAAQKYGEVIVVAPEKEQSAKSQALNIRRGLNFVEKEDYLPNVVAYALDSTPADCVRFANYFLRLEFDIVLAGINNGYNLGEDIMYSGTVGAASEGVMGGKKAIAFSTNPHDFTEAKNRIDEILEFFFSQELFTYGQFYNVNIPPQAKGIKFTLQGSTHFSTDFFSEGLQVFQRGKPNFHLDAERMNSDVYAIEEKYITITPLSVDRTDYLVLEKLKKKIGK